MGLDKFVELFVNLANTSTQKPIRWMYDGLDNLLELFVNLTKISAQETKKMDI